VNTAQKLFKVLIFTTRRVDMKLFAKGLQLAALAAVSAMMLTACGGSGGGGTSTAGPTVSSGVVTAKGSIFVNGIEYSTNGAAITIDGVSATEAQLKVGMTVKVSGTSDDSTKKGVATKVEARDALEGQIESVDNTAKTITVNGVTVKVEDNVTRLNDDDTVKIFSGAAFAVGNHVEVNGFADDQGGLRATRVAKKTAGTLEFESKGFVSALGASSFSLSLTPGGASFITVNFTAGQLPAGTANGSIVEVKSLAAPSAGAVTASTIRLEDRLGALGEKVEVEGIVSSGTVDSFVVNGQQVITDSATVYEGGLKSDFATGVKLEAEGPLNSSGAIVATKISFRSNIKIEGDASSVTPTSLSVLGKTVVINGFTRLTNGPINNNSHIEVRAMADRDGNLVATRIIVQSASNKAFIQGPVTAFDATAGTLTILGTTIVSDSSTQWRVSSTTTEAAVTKAAFFAQLKANVTTVKVRWDNFTALNVAVKEAEIELGK
jgi:hypothetical protein